MVGLDVDDLVAVFAVEGHFDHVCFARVLIEAAALVIGRNVHVKSDRWLCVRRVLDTMQADRILK